MHVPNERIVTAMTVWSEIGIVGCLLGPLAGTVTQALGFSWLCSFRPLRASS